MKKVLVAGTFDIIHPGHLFLLRQAKKKGDRLFAVVGRDSTVKKLKGYFPFFNQRERVANLRRIGLTDQVILGQVTNKLKIVEKLRPDVICLGYDQKAFTNDLKKKLARRGLKTRINRLQPYKKNKYKTSLLHQAGLVAIKNIDPSIISEPRYATRRNFLKKQLYLNKIILARKNIALMLRRAQNKLQRRGLGLKVWDCYRPLSVQKQMWEFKPDERYIGNPRKKPFHTRAAAVDCTLVDKNGKQLPMPTPFDEFSPRAHRDYPKHSLKAKKNMLLLEHIMSSVGFVPFPDEWWHYSDPDWKKYPSLNIPL